MERDSVAGCVRGDRYVEAQVWRTLKVDVPDMDLVACHIDAKGATASRPGSGV